MKQRKDFPWNIMDNAIDDNDVQAILDIPRPSITRYCI